MERRRLAEPRRGVQGRQQQGRTVGRMPGAVEPQRQDQEPRRSIPACAQRIQSILRGAPWPSIFLSVKSFTPLLSGRSGGSDVHPIALAASCPGSKAAPVGQPLAGLGLPPPAGPRQPFAGAEIEPIEYQPRIRRLLAEPCGHRPCGHRPLRALPAAAIVPCATDRFSRSRNSDRPHSPASRSARAARLTRSDRRQSRPR